MNRKQTSSPAFTLVELLIVIVVIAILAAISIVAYNGIQDRARASSVSSALTQATKKIKLWQVDNPDTTPASLSDADVTTPPNVTFQYARTNNNQDYCITATQGTTSYYLNSTTQTTPTSGGCPGHGVGGVQAVTNLAMNPGAVTIDYWGTYGGGTGGGSVPLSMSIVNVSWSSSGRAVRVTASSGATSTNAEIGTRNFMPTVPSSGSVSASMVMRASSQRPVAGYLRLRTNNGTNFIGSNVTLSTTPSKVSITVNGLTPGATYGITYKEPNGGAFSTGDYIEASNLIITDGTNQYNYADGNSPNWVWNGTPNSATSTGPAQ